MCMQEDEIGVNPVIKVWNVEKLDRQGHPTCVRISRAYVPNKAVSTSCLCLNDTLTLMAVGFIDGSVIIYRGMNNKYVGLQFEQKTANVYFILLVILYNIKTVLL